MEIYRHPAFAMACEQFDLIADLLQMPQADRERVKYPKRSLTVSVPVRMERGEGSTSLPTFAGLSVLSAELKRQPRTS